MEWININERLPNNSFDNLIVLDISNNMFLAYYNGYYNIFICSNCNNCNHCRNNTEIPNIVCWSKLPGIPR